LRTFVATSTDRKEWCLLTRVGNFFINFQGAFDYIIGCALRFRDPLERILALFLADSIFHSISCFELLFGLISICIDSTTQIKEGSRSDSKTVQIQQSSFQHSSH
jgi:hypothetical protein